MASLALTRLLWLQRQTRQAAYLRQTEATALLARTSIETCLVGLYCLHHTDAVNRLRSGNAKSMQRLFRFLVDIDLLPRGLFEAVAEVMGESAQPVTAKQMVEAIAAEPARSIAHSLYFRFYDPLSTFSAHAGGLALLRHVRRRGRVTRNPAAAWSRRSALRTVDASVGVLAAEIARRKGEDAESFLQYAHDHLERAFMPVLTLLRTGVADAAVKWREVPGFIRDFVVLRRDASAGRLDEQRVRQHAEGLFRRWTAAVETGLDDDVLERLVVRVTDAVVDEFRRDRSLEP
ncbi:MAG TPA: hypothetical protein VNG13_08340 [Mycobacteriales bacterium]|nr:hypothetical protein [Mycobacteriales bacterium]